MKRLRRLFLALSPVLAGVFALCVTAPRPELFYHRHAGGEHVHVHADGVAEEPWLHEFFSELRDRHRHSHQHDHQHRTGLQAADHGHAAGHWHHPQRYQRGLVASVAAPTLSSPLQPLPPASPPRAARIVAVDVHARGPPLPALSA